MDPKKQYSYSNLFNLESLINFQLPQLDDDFDYHGNSSQDESRGSPGGTAGNQSNGTMSGRELKKKRRTSYSSDEDGDRDRAHTTYISEEKYRTMLGEHVQKYKRRLGNSSASPAAIRNGAPVMRSGGGSRDQKSANDHRGGAVRLASTSEFFNNSTQSLGNHIQSDFLGPYGGDRSIYEPAFLDLGEDITYKIPPPYEKLALSLNLPTMSDIQVNEIYLKGTLDLETLAAMMASDKKLGTKRQAGMGDPKPQFESLQDANVLEKLLSRRYPDLRFHEALEEEKEKLHLELHLSQANNDPKQCRIIEHLIDVTQNVVNVPDEKFLALSAQPYIGTGLVSAAKVGQVQRVNVSQAEHQEKSKWQTDLFDCCSEPCLCFKVCIYRVAYFQELLVWFRMGR